MYYPINDIWKGLYSSKQKAAKAIERLQFDVLKVDEKESISKEDFISLLNDRLSTIKTEDGKQRVSQRIEELGAIVPTIKPPTKRATKVQKSPRMPKKKTVLLWHQKWSIALIKFLQTVADFVQSKPIVFVALLGVLIIQCHHLATLVNKVGQNDGVLIGYVFAIFAESSALLLVIHGGARNTLLGFAFFQFWTNCLYYISMPDIVIKLTLSAFIAFCLYSFSELYAKINLK